MTVRSYQVSSSSSFGRKRPSLPSAQVLRPLTTSVDYGSRATASVRRAGSVPPMTSSLSRAVTHRAVTPAPGYRSPASASTARRLSTAASVNDLRASSLSTRSPLGHQMSLSSRRSVSTSTLPGSRSNLRLSSASDDVEDYLGSLYMAPRRASAPARTSYPSARIKASYNYLDDIQEEEQASRAELSDLRSQAAKARQLIDSHRLLLDRVRSRQTDGPAMIGVRPSYTAAVSTVRHDNTPTYYRPVQLNPRSSSSSSSSYAGGLSELTVSPARRKLRDLLTRSKTSRQ